jgi:hypothetical protein
MALRDFDTERHDDVDRFFDGERSTLRASPFHFRTERLGEVGLRSGLVEARGGLHRGGHDT